MDHSKSGHDPRPVPFARDALAMLLKRGFASSEAQSFFAMFYQVRRAFHCISQELAGQSPSLQ